MCHRLSLPPEVLSFHIGLAIFYCRRRRGAVMIPFLERSFSGNRNPRETSISFEKGQKYFPPAVEAPEKSLSELLLTPEEFRQFSDSFKVDQNIIWLSPERKEREEEYCWPRPRTFFQSKNVFAFAAFVIATLCRGVFEEIFSQMETSGGKIKTPVKLFSPHFRVSRDMYFRPKPKNISVIRSWNEASQFSASFGEKKIFASHLSPFGGF